MEWVHSEGIPVHSGASQVAQWEKIYLPTQETQETWVPSLSQEDPLEEEMATHSGVLAWKSPWTEEAGRLQSMQSQRVEHYDEHACTQCIQLTFSLHLLLPSPQYCGFCSTHPDEITLWTLPGILQFDFSVTFAIANQLENSSSVFTALFLLLDFRTF